MLNFPNINPVAFTLFGIDIKWYGISYALGFLLGILYAKYLIKKSNLLEKIKIDDLLLWVALGTIIGGRLGYVLFYDFDFYSNNLSLILLDIRKGGMSFHGGLIGVTITCLIFSIYKKVSFYAVMDIVACCAPIGIFLGRLANFVNSELWGKTTNLPIGIVFPNGGDLPRHPSQIYEAFLEGVLLFLILQIVYIKKYSIFGFTSAMYLIFYSIFRILVEFFREPDSHIGYIANSYYLTMGMLLSLPMLFIGITLLFIIYVKHRK